MNLKLARITSLMIALLTCHPTPGLTQSKAVSWLDQPKPASWNMPGLAIPVAPPKQGPGDPRCRTGARPAELEADKRLQAKGWDLFGEYEGGWQTVVIRATADYDGMCRPLQYQVFVFVRGVFAGTLSPKPMDSRTDGALSTVSLQSNGRLAAQYLRYAATDALCCSSRTTAVEFEIPNDAAMVRPVSASTSPNN
jgi:LppP/LprE lipoprotein